VRGVVAELPPEPPDEDLQILGIVGVGGAPDALQQERMGQHRAGVADELLEQPVLDRRQANDLPVEARLPRRVDQGEAGEGEIRTGAGAGWAVGRRSIARRRANSSR